jgi:hypothetical protein
MGDVILDAGVKNFLRITRKGARLDGWAKASAAVYSVFTKGLMPSQLFEHHSLNEGGGMVRLTDEGNRVLDAMDLLRGYKQP